MGNWSLHNVRLRNKFLLVFFLAVFLPIMLTNVIFYNVTSNSVKEQRMNDISLALEQITSDFRMIVDDAIGVSATLYQNIQLNDFLDREYTTSIEYISSYDTVLRLFNRFSPMYSTIREITFFTDNPTVFFAGGVREISDEVKSTTWYSQLDQAADSRPIITSDGSLNNQIDTFSVVRKLNYYHGNDYLKFVKIDLNPRMIHQAFNNVTFPGDVYLINEHNVIEYTTKKTIDWERETHMFDGSSVPDDMVIVEHTYQLHYLNNFRVVGVVTEEEILEAVQDSRRLILYLACINVLVPSFAIIVITGSLHTRLRRILRHMQKMEDQHFEKIEGKDYRDEIGQLTSEFNRMSNKIRSLIEDVYQTNIQKKDLELKRQEAQLSALQSQINPHFLFNTLETLRMRSLKKEEVETAGIIQHLAKMMRNSIMWGKDWVTVEEELNIIVSFLQIQKYRFGDKLSYEIECDEAVKACMIPNMSLIPFVENASIHGIEKKKGSGTIKIRLYVMNENLICSIEDDGVGMKQVQLHEILRTLQQDEDMGENVGIKNVYYRLKMLYGEQFQFFMNSVKGEGTEVRIHFPVSRS